MNSEATSSIRRRRPIVACRQSFGKKVAQVVDLHAPLPHAGHELIVLVLSALHPDDVVEEQVVVIGGGEPLEAQLGAMHDHLAQLAYLGMYAERVHESSTLLSSISRR